jgi:hypothetical protein
MYNITVMGFQHNVWYQYISRPSFYTFQLLRGKCLLLIYAVFLYYKISEKNCKKFSEFPDLFALAIQYITYM